MKRFRLFAGPNGSGKSSIIKIIREHTVNGRKIDMGVYVNADEFAVLLKNNGFHFANFELGEVTRKILRDFVISSGLLRGTFTLAVFDSIYTLRKNHLILLDMAYKEMMAQVLSNFLVGQLAIKGKKFTMETVFSHPGKLELMRWARKRGYKVYLYFVATEDPEINKARVKRRVATGGHPVPETAIEDRYYRSLGLLFDAVHVAHRCYLFDNSGVEHQEKLVASCEEISRKKTWVMCAPEDVPEWFKEYYQKKSRD